jgi:hypothetical protein
MDSMLGTCLAFFTIAGIPCWRSFNEPKGMGVGQRGGGMPGQETARCAKVQWLSTNATFLASDKQCLLIDSFHLFEAFSSKVSIIVGLHPSVASSNVLSGIL